MQNPEPTFAEFIALFCDGNPAVKVKRAEKILNCGHSKAYDLRKQGLIRILPGAGGSVVPSVDLYSLHIATLRGGIKSQDQANGAVSKTGAEPAASATTDVDQHRNRTPRQGTPRRRKASSSKAA